MVRSRLWSQSEAGGGGVAPLTSLHKRGCQDYWNLLEPLELKSENLKRKRKKTERSERSSFSAVLSRKRGPAPLLALRLAAARCSLPCRCAYAVLGLQYAQDLPPSKTRIVENVLSRRHLPGDHTTTQVRPWLSLAYKGVGGRKRKVASTTEVPY